MNLKAELQKILENLNFLKIKRGNLEDCPNFKCRMVYDYQRDLHLSLKYYYK